MKLMRLKKEHAIKVPAKVDPDQEPYNIPFTFPQFYQVEVISELNNMIQVHASHWKGMKVEGLKFEVGKADLFVPKGQLVSIYRDASGIDCSLGGLSSKYERVILCGPGLSETFSETEDTPALQLWTRKINEREYTVAIPYDEPRGSWSFGGNFAYSCDSRVRSTLPPYGICPIHDRDMAKERP